MLKLAEIRDQRSWVIFCDPANTIDHLKQMLGRLTFCSKLGEGINTMVLLLLSPKGNFLRQSFLICPANKYLK